MTWKKDEVYFHRAIELSKTALATGNDGFGCVMVDENGEIILEQGNAVLDENDPTAHDALMAIRRTCQQFGKEKLSKCTLYATMEPCVMCMCGAYWAGLKAIKFAVSEQELNDMFGGGGLDIHSREFVERASSNLLVEGPFNSVHDEAVEVIQAWVNQVLGK